MSTAPASTGQIEEFMEGALNKVLEKEVDSLIEQAIERFNIEVQKERAQLLVHMTAHILESMRDFNNEIVIRIPYKAKI